MLTVNILENKGQREEATTKTEIADIFRKHLLRLGFREGRWDIDIIKKTSKVCTHPLEYMHHAARKFYYQVQSSERSNACWRIVLHIPVFVDPVSVIAAERGLAENGTSQMNNTTEEAIQITVGQIHKATIREHLEYGLKIQIGEYEGIILLADISEDYDKNDLFRYPVGKVIPVLISSIDDKKKQIVCSTKIETVASTTDLFTGVPNKDGSLSLLGFARDLHRKYELVERLAILCMDDPNHNVKHDVAVAHIDSFFKEKFNATTLDKRGLSALLTGISSGDFAWLKKTDDGYTLTELGWETIEGQSKPKPAPEIVEPQPDNTPESEPEPKSPELVTSQTNAIKEAGSYTQLKKPEEPEDEKHLEDFKEHMPRKADAHNEVIQENRIKKTDLDEVAECLGRMARLHAITHNISALITEQEEIQKWLDNNRHLHIIANRLFQKMMREG